MADTLTTDLYVKGWLGAESMGIPAGTIKNPAVAPDAGIDADKLENRHVAAYRQDDGSDVVAAIVPIHINRGTTGTLKAVEVACVDAPEGGDKAFTVDVKKANQAAPTPATVLDAVVTVDSTVADCQVKAAIITDSDLADGDVLLVVVAVSGSTGNQGQGLVVTLTIDQTPT